MTDSRRIRIRVDGFVDGPLAIWDGTRSPLCDRPIFTDGLGRPAIPGTSIAGALRATYAIRFGEARAREVFGFEEGDGEVGAASSVTVHEAEYTGPEVDPEIRWHVTIGRRRLTKVDEALFTEEVWPHRSPFLLRFDTPAEHASGLLAALSDLGRHGLGFGSGPQPFHVTAVEIGGIDDAGRLDRALALGRDVGWNEPIEAGRLSDPEVLEWIPLDEWQHEGEIPTATVEDVGLVPPDIAGEGLDTGDGIIDLRLALTWRLESHLRTGRPLDRWESDHGEPDNALLQMGIVEGDTIRRRYALAGEGMHGVLRQRCERGLRFLTGDTNLEDDPRRVGQPVIADLFGHAGSGRDDPGLAGTLHVSDFLASEDATTTQSNRIAIDRLTGSVYRSSYWIDLALEPGCTLAGHVTLQRPDRSPLEPIHLGLLAAALRDLADQRVGVGGGSRAGNGTLSLIDWEIEISERNAGKMTRAISSGTGPIIWPDTVVNRFNEAIGGR